MIYIYIYCLVYRTFLFSYIIITKSYKCLIFGDNFFVAGHDSSLHSYQVPRLNSPKGWVLKNTHRLFLLIYSCTHDMSESCTLILINYSCTHDMTESCTHSLIYLLMYS